MSEFREAHRNILYAIVITAICATLTSLIWTEAASADGNGELTFVEVEKDGVGGVDGLYGVISVTVSPDGKYVYSASVTDGAVAAFGRNATTGELTFVEDEKDGTGGVDEFDRAASIALNPDGKRLYAAAKNDDALAVFSQNAMVGNLTFIEIVEDGEGGNGLDGAISVTVSPDGNHVYATSNQDHTVTMFIRNGTTGNLTFVEAQEDGV
ncbi:MAG TPA: hypothetical protein DDY93_02085 [Dehalococcoidia bacterium]|nr:hypothetical protein [Dehalococcoidia bacterium]